MNEKAKRLLSSLESCSENFVPPTPEQLEERRLIRHRAYLRADRALQPYEDGQIAAIQELLSNGRRYSG